MKELLPETKPVRQQRGRPRVIVPCALRPEQAQRLKLLAAERDLPCSILIRMAIDRFLAASEVER